MTSVICDLTVENNTADKAFALSLYLPPFAKKTVSRDTEKVIKLAEVRKQLKKIRTDVWIETDEIAPLHLLLALIVSGLMDASLELSVFAAKGARQWQQFKLSADLNQLTRVNEKQSERLIQAASHLGHFHSKPLNTLSSIQFCRDPNYSATGEFGFTENQRNNKTASLSISGGSNAFSVFYALLITRINGLSIAEHLIQQVAFSIKIQTFFKTLLSESDLARLQSNIRQALNKTASDLGDVLHVMDKQITLPIHNDNSVCDYLNITPIINPTLFAATSRSIFYIKDQSVRFINIELGGTNPSNAGTAVGEVAGQNARLQMSFPVSNRGYAQQIIASLNYKGCYFWAKQFKQDITYQLLHYENNPNKLPNNKKRSLLKHCVAKMMENIQEQLNEIDMYLQSLPEEQQNKVLVKKYNDFFEIDKASKKTHAIWYDTLIYTLKSINKLSDTVEFKPLIKEIKQQFEQQVYTKGGF
jgi:hypothetical protein